MSKVNKEGAQQTSLLDVLKKKMRQAREEAEAAKDEADEVRRQFEEEKKKREDVNFSSNNYALLSSSYQSFQMWEWSKSLSSGVLGLPLSEFQFYLSVKKRQSFSSRKHYKTAKIYPFNPSVIPEKLAVLLCSLEGKRRENSILDLLKRPVFVPII